MVDFADQGISTLHATARDGKSNAALLRKLFIHVT